MAKKAAPDAKAAKVKKAKPVTGFAPLKHKDFTITQKRSGRFEVKNAKGANINAEEKVKILLEAKILKPSEKKPAAETSAT